jgi:hypothetical protein
VQRVTADLLIDTISTIVAAFAVFFRSRLGLSLEVLALRQQVVALKRKRRRPVLSRLDRLFWITLRSVWPRWSDVLAIVKPATVIAWHRHGFRLYWQRKGGEDTGRTFRMSARKTTRRPARVPKDAFARVADFLADTLDWLNLWHHHGEDFSDNCRPAASDHLYPHL